MPSLICLLDCRARLATSPSAPQRKNSGHPVFFLKLYCTARRDRLAARRDGERARLQAPQCTVVFGIHASVCMHSKVASQLVHVSSHVVPCVTGAVQLRLFSVSHSGQFHNMVKPSVGSVCSGSIRSSFPLKVPYQLQSEPKTAPTKILSGNSKPDGLSLE